MSVDKARARFTREEKQMDECERRKMQELTIRVADRNDAEAIAHIYIDSWNAGFKALRESASMAAHAVEKPPGRWYLRSRPGPGGNSPLFFRCRMVRPRGELATTANAEGGERPSFLPQIFTRLHGESTSL
jgi:hypothetical protein